MNATIIVTQNDLGIKGANIKTLSQTQKVVNRHKRYSSTESEDIIDDDEPSPNFKLAKLATQKKKNKNKKLEIHATVSGF